MNLQGIEDFALERYFARWEFSVKRQLGASDVEPLRMAELLELADPDSRERWDALTLGYTETAGLPALREAIAGTYRNVGPDQVLVLSGAEEGIFLALSSMLGPDDHAVVVVPSYQSLHEVARVAGASITKVPLLHENEWQLNPEDVERAVTRDTRLIVINFPHNPTGAQIPEETLRRLVAIADQSDAILFSDEVYRGLEQDPADLLPAAADISERAVSLGVMSKSLALPGLRIGWLVTRNAAWLDRVARLKDYTTICASAPSEILALMGLRARDRILERSREIVQTNLAHADAFFEGRGDQVEWVRPRAGSVGFPRLLTRNSDEIAARLVERSSVLIAPGGLFHGDPAHFRLGLGRRDFPIALESLGSVLSEMR